VGKQAPARDGRSGPSRVRPDLFVQPISRGEEHRWVVKYRGCERAYVLRDKQFAELRSLADAGRSHPNTPATSVQRSFEQLGLVTWDGDTALRSFAPSSRDECDPVALAWWAVKRFTAGHWTYIDAPMNSLAKPNGCYVCLKMGGRLRGCFGTLRPFLPHLAAEIVQNTIAAACWDERFVPLTSSELPSVTLTVDVVGECAVADPRKLEWSPRDNGLQLRAGERALATLLPALAGINSAKEQVDFALSKARLNRLPSDVVIERFATQRLPHSDLIPVDPFEPAMARTHGS
jgi:AMMECR1 domain-containing protein